MNLVGKILVTLIFVMTAVYLGFAVSVYSTHKSWRDKAKDVSTKLAKVKTDLANEQQKAVADQDKLSKEITTYQGRVGQLENEFDALKKQIETLTAERDAKAKELREATAAATAAVTNVEAADKKVDQLRSELQTARDDKSKLFTEYVEKLDALNSASAESRRLIDTNGKLTEQLTKAKLVLDRRGLSIETDVSAEPPKVDGVVLAVGPQGLMEISIGADDGLNRGHTLEVTRGTQYLGRVVVIDTRPEKAVAKALPDFQKGKIERNDRVATRIN